MSNCTSYLAKAISVTGASQKLGLQGPFKSTFSVGAKANSLTLPPWIWGLALIWALWGTFSANPILSPMAAILLPIGLELLWRRGEPPVLAFIYSIQWLQASIAIFHANYYGVSLATFFGGYEAETATWLSLVGVFALALGMRVGLLRHDPASVRSVAKIDVHAAFRVYLIGFAVFSIMDQVAWIVPGLAQPILAAASFKWALVYVLFLSIIEQRQGYVFMFAAVALEAAIGVLGYFASFKTVFFVLLIAVMTAHEPFRGRRIRFSFALIALIALSGVVWTSIKNEYRDFLNQGSGMQQVLVPVQDRAKKLLNVTSDFSLDDLGEGFEEMLFRISYIKFFSLTLVNVPDTVPYENGSLWLGAIEHVLKPRLLFPGKAAINDSDRTSLYTGVQVATAEQGTSIGIGYMGESYIDFGPIWMFAPIVALGLFYGLIYRYFIAAARFRLPGFAIGTALLLPAAQDFGASNIKILGGAVIALIVGIIVYQAAKQTLPDLA